MYKLFKIILIIIIGIFAITGSGGGDDDDEAEESESNTTAGRQWTWVSGSDAIDEPGTYGAMGTADASNIPGARDSGIGWIDSLGNLWLFGGYGLDKDGAFDDLNDLWRFNPSSELWTWVSGSDAVNQQGVYGTLGSTSQSQFPGARDSGVSWIDSSGKLWLFGGYGYVNNVNPGDLNDLWNYNPSTKDWTWASGDNTVDQAGEYGEMGTAGASNTPGARHYAISWIDSSDNLWLFGGIGYDSSDTGGELNDLWKFNPSSGQWTWVSGNNTVNQTGVYGTKGTADASNTPGARISGASWIDTSGDLWLFGGFGRDATGTDGNLNDLWRFNPSSGEWTWLSGNNTVDQTGVYGTKGTAEASNSPGGRYGGSAWTDSSGDLWLFGGIGYAASGSSGNLNDLWKYDTSSGAWTWISGNNTIEQPGAYGTMGTAGASNTPGARNSGISWIDSSDTLWLFGGIGLDADDNYGDLNDLWQFNQ